LCFFLGDRMRLERWVLVGGWWVGVSPIYIQVVGARSEGHDVVGPDYLARYPIDLAVGAFGVTEWGADDVISVRCREVDYRD
jgi:hypothetical protein